MGAVIAKAIDDVIEHKGELRKILKPASGSALF